MRPALSVLFFTTLSGAGYGLWFLLGLAVAVDAPLAQHGGAEIAAWLAGFVLSTAGLLFSVAHLGQPTRAWRAFSQWRSSWLSREGVAAVGCAAIAVALAAATIFDFADAARRGLGVALLASAVLVVFCTARLYSSLPTIAAWHNRYTLPVFLAVALYTGTLWWWLIAILAGADATLLHMPIAVVIAITAVGASVAKLAYWRHIDHARVPASTGSMTGLDHLGSVRSAEHPHTEANYLTREMAFVLARKHSRRLRIGVMLLGSIVPACLLAASLAAPGIAVVAAALALLSAMLAAFVERWLFFAEARHVVALYYGARAA